MATPNGFTSLSATRIQDAGGNLLSGSLIVTPTDANDIPLDVVAGGVGGPVVADCEFPYVAGVLDPSVCWIPTSPATTNPNTSYRFTFQDASGKILKVWTTVQVPAGNFDLDTYQPILSAAQAVVQNGPPGPPGTIGMATVPANVDSPGYPNTNPSALASSTALNPGLSVYSDVSNAYGIDLGAAPFAIGPGTGYYTRAYAPESKAFGAAFHTQSFPSPSSQSSFDTIGFLSKSSSFDFFPSNTGVPAATVLPDGTGKFKNVAVNATNAQSATSLNPNVTLYSSGASAFGFDLGATQFNLPGGNPYYLRSFQPTGNAFGVSFYPNEFISKQSDYNVHALLAKATSVDFYADPVTGVPAVAITPDGTGKFKSVAVNATNAQSITSLNPNVTLYSSGANAFGFDLGATQFNLPGGNPYYLRSFQPTGNAFGVSFYPNEFISKQSDYNVHALLAKATSVDFYADPVTGVPAVAINPDGNVTVAAAMQDSNFRFTRRRGLTSVNKIMLYGDSRSSTDYAFNATAVAALAGCPVYNGGFSGFTAAQLASRAQMQRIFYYDADVIFALIGGNDVGVAGSVGTLSGGVAGEPVVSEQDLSTDYSGTYFIQAMSYFVRYVTTSYYGIRTRANLTGNETEDQKNALIAAVRKPVLFVATDLPQQRNSAGDPTAQPANWQRKRDAIVEVCAKYHVQCIDLLNILPFAPFMSFEPYFPGPASVGGATNKTNNQGIYFMDGLHPNQFGWEMIAQAYCNAAGL